VPVFGPWSGTLNDTRDTLKLLQPGTPELDGTVPYYRVDHVTYHASDPWYAPGIGVSLERVPLEAYGNDPVNWRPGLFDGTPGISAANRSPVMTLSGIPIISQGAQLSLNLMVSDLDVPWQTVTLRAIALPPGSTFDPTQGRLLWVPSLTQGPGEFLARFTATDDAACGPIQTSLDVAIQVTQPLVLSGEYIAGRPQVSFAAGSGEIYHVEFCADLTTANWQLLEEVAVSRNQIVTVVDPGFGQSAARFYRIRWVSSFGLSAARRSR
jgi:hypothetical protein